MSKAMKIVIFVFVGIAPPAYFWWRFLNENIPDYVIGFIGITIIISLIMGISVHSHSHTRGSSDRRYEMERG